MINDSIIFYFETSPSFDFRHTNTSDDLKHVENCFEGESLLLKPNRPEQQRGHMGILVKVI